MYQKLFKPLLDFIVACLALLFLSPLLIIVSLLLFFANRGKVFFVQGRPGKDETLFHIIKFKTMNDRKDLYGNLASDAERLTIIGKFIRKTSLDETPQLLNVIKGDMSLIGPRPLLPEYLPLYSKNQKKRHRVKPGITGWAQVNGRNAISWEQKFDFDIWYVLNISFWLDLKIVFLTIKKVLSSEDIAVDGSATIGRFKGN